VIQEVNQTIKNGPAPALASNNRAETFYGRALNFYRQAIRQDSDAGTR
jgi:hypothetical protein